MRIWQEVWCGELGSHGSQQDRMLRGCLWPHTSSFPVPGKESSLLPATETIAWTRHEALMAGFCPVCILGFHLVADGPLPRWETWIGTPGKADILGTKALQLSLVEIQKV